MMINMITKYQDEVDEEDAIKSNQVEKSPVNIIRELMVNPKFSEEKTPVFAKSTKKNSNRPKLFMKQYPN